MYTRILRVLIIRVIMGVIMTVLTQLGLMRHVNAKSTAEILGFSNTDRVLIIHADDIGMSHTVNRAALHLLQFGLVKSGSVMTPCPWANRVRTLLETIPEVDLGIHITLTSEWKNYKWSPLSGTMGLKDPKGYFWPTLSEAVQHASPEDILKELEAQIAFARKLGMNPSHIDSHMGVHFAKPDYLSGVVALSKKYQIPAMLVRWSPEFEIQVRRYQLDPDPIREITNQAEKDGAVLLDYLVTSVPGKTFKERKSSYDHFLKSLKPGVTQLIIHPGFLDDEMQGIMEEAPEGLYRRDADTRYFSSPETKNLISKLGIKLIGWRDLLKVSRKKE